jgi:hypothetical protein
MRVAAADVVVLPILLASSTLGCMPAAVVAACPLASAAACCMPRFLESRYDVMRLWVAEQHLLLL